MKSSIVSVKTQKRVLLRKEFSISGFEQDGTYIVDEVNDSLVYVQSEVYFCRMLGQKQYELINHLGNVLATVLDRKTGIFDLTEDTLMYYEADVVNATLYYPFGMNMERYANIDFAYSYGMNTQEKDDEIYGEGNSYTAEFWQYDARLGRRWNNDPRPNPSISVYACFANNPIWFSDVKGDTVKIEDPSSESGFLVYSPGMQFDGSNEIISQTVNALNKLYTGPTGKLMIDDLHAMESSILITRQSYNKKSNYYHPEAKVVGWNPNIEVTAPIGDGTGNDFVKTHMDPFLVLGHELGHAWDYNFNKSQSVFGLNPDALWYSPDPRNSVFYSEVFAVHVENLIRLEHRFPLRTHYSLHKDNTGDYLGQLIHTTSTGNYSMFNVRTTTLIQVANPCFNEFIDYSPMGSEFQEVIWKKQNMNSAFKYE